MSKSPIRVELQQTERMQMSPCKNADKSPGKTSTITTWCPPVSFQRRLACKKLNVQVIKHSDEYDRAATPRYKEVDQSIASPRLTNKEDIFTKPQALTHACTQTEPDTDQNCSQTAFEDLIRPFDFESYIYRDALSSVCAPPVYSQTGICGEPANYCQPSYLPSPRVRPSCYCSMLHACCSCNTTCYNVPAVRSCCNLASSYQSRNLLPQNCMPLPPPVPPPPPLIISPPHQFKIRSPTKYSDDALIRSIQQHRAGADKSRLTGDNKSERREQSKRKSQLVNDIVTEVLSLLKDETGIKKALSAPAVSAAKNPQSKTRSKAKISARLEESRKRSNSSPSCTETSTVSELRS